MQLDFLPYWPPQVNGFLVFGLILLAGLIGGRLASRTGYVPRITGFIAIGLLLGPSGLGFIQGPVLTLGTTFSQVALGLILFSLGYQLHFKEALMSRGLLVSSAAECTLSFVAVYLALRALDLAPVHAALAAALGVSSSPAVLLLVVKELGAEGAVTRRAINLVALNNVIAFFAFTLVLPFLHLAEQASIERVVLDPLYKVAGSLLLAYLLARTALLVGGFVGRSAGNQFTLFVAGILIGLGVADMLRLSQLLTLLSFGIMVRTLNKGEADEELDFGRGGDLFFIVLFVMAGAKLHLHDLAVAGYLAVAFVVARIGAKCLGLALVARVSGLTMRQQLHSGLTLSPMAGLAIGLVSATEFMYPQTSAPLVAVVLASVAILETIGPPLTEYALKAAGEVRADAEVKH